MSRRRSYRRRSSSSRRRNYRSRSSLGAVMRRPSVQISILLVVALVIFLIASLGGEEQASNTLPSPTTTSLSSTLSATEPLPAFVSVDEAYQLYQSGTFFLDVRSPEEWNDYHAPNTTLIPLEELPSRVNELPKGQPIVVVCRSGNRSQEGRDILLGAGFDATSMTGGLNEWRDSGYPIASGP